MINFQATTSSWAIIVRRLGESWWKSHILFPQYENWMKISMQPIIKCYYFSHNFYQGVVLSMDKKDLIIFQVLPRVCPLISLALTIPAESTKRFPLLVLIRQKWPKRWKRIQMNSNIWITIVQYFHTFRSLGWCQRLPCPSYRTWQRQPFWPTNFYTHIFSAQYRMTNMLEKPFSWFSSDCLLPYIIVFFL